MRKLQIALLAALAGLGYVHAFGQLGKCNTEHITPIPVPMSEIEKKMKWRIAYSTDPKRIGDHEEYTLQQVLGGRNYKVKNRKVYKDKSEAKYDLGLKYVDNVLVEDIVEKSGKRHRVYLYPLAITSTLAGLIYRCSDNGNPNVDDRIIAFPADVVPSEEDIQRLLAVDKAIFPNSSRGTLVKLPEKVKD